MSSEHGCGSGAKTRCKRRASVVPRASREAGNDDDSETRTRANSNHDIEPGTNDTFIEYRSGLWRMADALRGSMDAAEYKHVVLGLIFLKYISDAFEEAHAGLEAELDQGADPEDPGRIPRPEYLLGAAGGSVGKSTSTGPPGHHRPPGG